MSFWFSVGLVVIALVCLLFAVSRSATYTGKLDVTRTITGEGIPPNSQYLVSGLDTLTTMNGSTTPACSSDVCFTEALVSGAVTIDLTNITDPVLGTVSLNGLTPYMILFQNPAFNANPITIKEGATNGYTGLGTSFLVTLQPGDEIRLLKQVASVVGSTSKTFDLTGTGTQALAVQIAAG